MKVTLRKYRLSDLERVCKLFIDDAVLDNLAVSIKAKDISREDEEKWLRKTLAEYYEKNPESFKLAIIAEGEYVGSIGTHHVDYRKKTTEIGYWIGKPYWGRGITTLAIRRFVRHISKEFGFKTIKATPYGYNIASQRVLEKAGFELVKKTEKSYKKGRKLLDEMHYVWRVK